MRQKTAIGLALAVITLWVYWPVSHFPFIAYDDLGYVADNPQVKAGLSWAGVNWAFSHLIVSNWHPVTTLSHMLDCQLFGLNPGAHHLVNVALHIANALLLFALLTRMTQATWRSAAVSALFALHPLHVESVAWIAERKDVLSTLFFLLTLIAYAAYVENLRPQSTQKPQRRRGARVFYVIACVLFALGLMSKPMVVTLPGVLLLLDFWPLKRFQEATRSTYSRLLIEKAPFVVLAITSCIVTLLVQKAGGAMIAASAIPWPARLANALQSYFTYLVKTFWPTNLAVLYPHPALNHSHHWSAIELIAITGVLICITGACLRELHRRPWLAVGWLWFLGTLLPVIGLVQVGTQAMADRYMYIPSIGLAISVVWGVTELLAATQPPLNNLSATGRKYVPKTVWAAALGSVALTACAILATCQVRFWRSTTALFQHTIAVTGENPTASGLLALGLEAEGRLDEAIDQYRLAATADPKFNGHLALLLAGQHKTSEAAERFEAALRDNPKEIEARLGLAQMLQELGKNEAAAEQFETVLRQDSNSVAALNNLAWLRATCAEAAVRNGNQAVDLASRACELTQFGQTMFIGTLAAAYAEAGRFDEAITTAQRACDLAFEKGEQDLVTKNQQLLQLYKSRKPFHESPAGAVQ